jgi:hypothetical protein
MSPHFLTDSSKALKRWAPPNLITFLGWIALAISLVAMCVQVSFAWIGLPIPDGDATYFLPVAMEMARGEFAHPYWHPAGSENTQFNWHGWLYPFALSILPTTKTAQTVVFSATLFGLISVLPFLAFALLRRLAPAVAIALMLVVVNIALYQLGRPEGMVTFLIGIGLVWLALRKSPKITDLFLCFVCALILVSQPVIGVAMLICLALYICHTSTGLPIMLLRGTLCCLGSILLAIILTMAFTPVPISSWLEGLQANAALTTDRTDLLSLESFFAYWIANPKIPFAFLFLLIFALLARSGLATKTTYHYLISLFLLLLLIAFVILMGLRLPATIYNFIALIPLALAVFALKAEQYWFRQSFLFGLAGIATLSISHSAVQTATASNGVSIHQFQTKIAELEHCPVRVSSSLWPAAAEAIGRDRLCRSSRSCTVLVVPQANSGLSIAPSQMNGIALSHSYFRQDGPRFIGIPVGRTRKDYAFAVYGRCTKQ